MFCGFIVGANARKHHKEIEDNIYIYINNTRNNRTKKDYEKNNNSNDRTLPGFWFLYFLLGVWRCAAPLLAPRNLQFISHNMHLPRSDILNKTRQLQLQDQKLPQLACKWELQTPNLLQMAGKWKMHVPALLHIACEWEIEAPNSCFRLVVAVWFWFASLWIHHVFACSWD